MLDLKGQSRVEYFYGESGPGIPSEKQLKFLFDLAANRVAPHWGHDRESRVKNLAAQIKATLPRIREVSRWIDSLLEQPVDSASAPGPKATVQVGPGVYLHDDNIFVVQYNKTKTRLYALRLVESPPRLNEEGVTVDFDLQYAPGIIFALKEEQKMTVEQAKPFMIRYGKCLKCKRKLKAASSVERGIGPVCIQYYAQ